MFDIFSGSDGVTDNSKDEVNYFIDTLNELSKSGFSRVYNCRTKEVLDISDLKLSVKTVARDYLVLVDRLVISAEKDDVSRFIDSLEVTFSRSRRIIIYNLRTDKYEKYSSYFECYDCRIKYEEPTPRLFSFNSPQGACPECQGTGYGLGIDENLVVPDQTLSLKEQCILPYNSPVAAKVFETMLNVCEKYNVRTKVPYKDLSYKEKQIL